MRLGTLGILVEMGLMLCLMEMFEEMLVDSGSGLILASLSMLASLMVAGIVEDTLAIEDTKLVS
jgi:hypothetical protein